MIIENQSIKQIRQTVTQHFDDLGVEHGDLETLNESVLHDGQSDVAVRFRAGTLIALWNMPQKSIHFYDNHGSKLRTVHAW